MCGIAGAYAYQESAPPVDAGELLRIREAMVNRGPDGAGLWLSADQRTGLAHRRLAIIDIGPGGEQPMATADGRYRITFNGEIYNYRELRRELQARGYRFRTDSDTEVLLQLYADRGASMVHHLRGMYAFAIWDDAQRSLFLARDPFGIKPLYYADDGKAFRFASQVKALLKGGAVAGSPEPAGYVGFFLWGSVPEPYTLYREIRSLPAGSTLTVKADRAGRCLPFFDVRDHFTLAASDSDLLEALRDSVSHHLIADVRVGAFLSAGLDSTTLTALAAEMSVERLHTVTLAFQEYVGTANDEASLAAHVSARCGARHDTHWIRRTDFEAALEALLGAMDQPSIDGVNTYFVSQAAASAGMKVAISGVGGDELFGGYPSFRDVPRMKRLAAALGKSTKASKAFRRVMAPVAQLFTSPKYAGMLEYGGSYGGAYLLRRGLYMPWELGDVLDPDMATAGWEALQVLERLQDDVLGLTAERPIVAALEARWYMRNQLLRDSDWAGMAHSVEIRLPYVDVPFFSAVAPRMAQARPPVKADLARRLPHAIPPAVLKRNKTGFLVPLREWCKQLSDSGYAERGLRGWARLVMQRSHGDVLTRARVGRARGRPVTRQKSPHSHASGRHGQPPVRWSTTPFNSARRALHVARRTEAAVAYAAYRILNAVLNALAATLWPGRASACARRVCVFRIGNIGDLTCALPAIRAVRLAYPKAHLTLLTSPGLRGRPGADDLRRGLEWIDDVLVYYAEDIRTLARRWALLRELRRRRFDVWVELPNNLSTVWRQARDMVFTRMVGAGWARGWQIATVRYAAQSQSEHLVFADEVERLLGILENAGIPVSRPDYGLRLPADGAAAVDRMLDRAGLGHARLVALAPAAKRSTNLWPAERFAEVGRTLAALGYGVCILGGESDRDPGRALAELIGDRAFSCAGELSVLESCELLRRCDLLIGVDSGLQHLASAVDTPAVSLFSFWQMLGKWRPHGAKSCVIQKWVSCHTCLLEDCPRGNRCMTDITVPEVMQAAREVMAA